MGFLSGANWGTAGLATAIAAFVVTAAMLGPGLGAALVFGRGNPAARTLILRATLVGLVACPFASIVFGHLGMGALSVMPRLTEVVTSTTSVVSTAAPTESRHRPGSSGATEAIQASESDRPMQAVDVARLENPAAPANDSTPAMPITASSRQVKFSTANAEKVVVGSWIVVSLLLLARIAIANAVIGVRRLRARLASDAVVSDCRRLAAKLGLKAPAVLVGDSVGGPCLVGWWRPAIMLPVKPENIDSSILAHELAHVSRNDCGWQLFVRVAAALVWYQPLIWVLARDMERTAEEACDDIVLDLGGDRAGYARQLVELAESTQRGWAVAGAELRVVGLKSSVGRRVARLLSASQLIHTNLRWPMRCAILLATIGLTCALAAALAGRSQTAQSSTSPGMMRFEGRVVSTDGKPVANAELNLIQYARFAVQSLATVTSGSDGQFVFEILPQEESATKPFDVVARVKGSALRSYRVKPGEFDELRLEPATQVKVIFLDPDGNPIQGMQVVPESFVNPVIGLMTRQDTWYLRPPETLSRALGQVTDSSGVVTFSDLPRSMMMQLEVDDQRYANPGVNDRVSLASDADSPTATLRLEHGCSLSGRVVYGTTSAPAADVYVCIQGSSRGRSASGGMVKTDHEGNFHKANLRASDYNVALYLPPALDKDWTATARENLHLEPGQNMTGIQLTMIHGAIVRGKVTLADTGKPLFGNEASVGSQGPAHPRSGAAVQSVLIDRDGNYAMRVPPGEQYIFLQGPIPDAYIGREQPHKEITVANGETATVDFVLPRRAGKAVTGVVLDADGKPVANASVSAESREIGMYSSPTVQTDAAGAFRLEGVTPGTELRARHGADGTKSPVILNGTERSVQLILVRGAEMDATILVTDEAHKPIAHPRLKMTVSNGSYGMGMGEPMIGSADGRITLSHLLIDLQYEIYVEADGYGEDTEALKLNPANREAFTVVLKKATTTIKGVVIDSDKQPVAGIPVALDTGNFIHLRTTDSTGHFVFPVVEKQLWKVMVRNDRADSFTIAAQHFDEKEIESRFAQGDREPVEFEVPKLPK